MNEIVPYRHEPSLPPALPEAARTRYREVIFERVSDNKADIVPVVCAAEAVASVGMNIAVDCQQNQVSVRADIADERKRRVASTFVHGAVAIAEQTYNEFSTKADTTLLAPIFAKQAAEQAVRQIAGNPQFLEDFGKYYGGLRWSTDQDSLIAALFRHTTDLNLSIVERDLTSWVFISIARKMADQQEGVPGKSVATTSGDSISSNMYDLPVAQLLEQLPYADYRKLQDPEFAATPEGQRLAEHYRLFCGEQAAQLYKRYPRPIDENGFEIRRAKVPIAKVPLIEALVAQEVSTDQPRAKYDMGPGGVKDLVLASDSRKAQAAIVATVNTRLPAEKRNVFDGPNEFQHKALTIGNILKAYRNSATSHERDFWCQQISTIIDAYTGEGVLAQNVRDEIISKKNAYQTRSLAAGVTSIQGMLFRDILTSPDVDVLLPRFLQNLQACGSDDPLVLKLSAMKIAMLDAAFAASSETRFAAFREAAERVFGSTEIAQGLTDAAQSYAHQDELRTQPAVLLARKKRQNFEFSDESEAAQAALREHGEALQPAEEAYAEAIELKNEQVFAVIQQEMNEREQTSASRPQDLTEIIKRVSFGGRSYEKVEPLPSAYHKFVELALSSKLTETEKSAVAWHISDNLRTYNEKAGANMVQLSLDIFRVMLGDVDNMHIPSQETSIGLASVSHIADSNRSMFRWATPGQLQKFAQYKARLQMLQNAAEQKTLPAEVAQQTLRAGIGYRENQDVFYNLGENAESAIHEIERLENIYGEFLYKQDVNLHPQVYYPWALGELRNLLGKLNLEVGNYSPGRDVVNLRASLSTWASFSADIREAYAEGYDPVRQGGLGELLIIGYEQMVLPHQIKYNTVVWQDGLSFMYNLIRNMPEKVYKSLKQSYASHQRFVEYLEATRAK